MRVLVSGATGLVGEALTQALEERGDTPVLLSRRPGTENEARVVWNPAAGVLDPAALDGVAAVVHLAGENVSDGRWSEAKKQRILDSRVNGTRLLAEAIAAARTKPGVLVSASAMGYYGDTGDAVVDEASPAGSGFLAEVCQQWEAATAPAEAAGVRTVHYRIGLVLSADGGALAKMLAPFKAGLGGPLGNGRMWMSWISIDDLVRGILHCIDTESLAGPVNAVAPHPVTNRDFTKALGRVLRRPTLFPVPAPAIRLLFGEMGEALLLSSARVHPTRLSASGYHFAHPEIGVALQALLREDS